MGCCEKGGGEGEEYSMVRRDEEEGKSAQADPSGEKDPYSAPDGGWGWVVMAASFLCNLVLDGIGYSFGVFLTPLMNHFEVEKGPMSLVGSVLSGATQLVGPFAALLVNKLGARVVCIMGAVLSALGFFSATYAPSVPLLTFLYGFTAGSGLGLMYVPALVAVGHYFEKRRAFATGISTCGSGAGTIVFAPLTSLLLNLYGWEITLRIFSGFCLLCVVCGLVMKPLPKRPQPVDEAGNLVEEEEKEGCCKSIVSSACSPKLMTSLPFLLLLLFNLFSTMGLYIPYTYLPTHAESRGISAVDASFLISIVGICNTLGRILSGLITDLPCIDPLVVTMTGLGLGGASTLLMVFSTDYWAFVIVSVGFGGFLSAWVAVTSPVLVEMLGLDLLTSGFGTLTFVRGCAAFLGPPLAGFIVDSTGDLNNAFFLSAGLLFISTIICFIAWIIKRSRNN